MHMYNINHSLRELSGILPVNVCVVSIYVSWFMYYQCEKENIIHLCTNPEKNSNPSSAVLCLQLENCYYDRLGNQC